MYNLISLTVAFLIQCTAEKLTCFHDTKELVAFSMSATEHFRLNTAVVSCGFARCRFPKQLLSTSVYVQMVNSAIEGEELQNLIVSLQSTNFGAFLQPRSLTEAKSLLGKVTFVLLMSTCSILRKYVFQIARLDISKSNLNYWFFWMESVYERDPNLDMKLMMSNITFSTQVRLLFVAGSRLNTSYDVYTVCSGQQSIICRVGKWSNSSLEISEDDTASNKFDLKGAQIRISAINVSLM